MPGFDPSPRVVDLRKRVSAFMDEHVYPNEATWAAQVNANRWQPTAIMEELKVKARRRGCGTCSCRVRSAAPA